MIHFKSLTLFTFLLFANLSLCQSYIGHTVDNYSGIQGVTYNPSNIVASHFKSDINLISVSGFVGSDYFGIKVQDIINSDGGFDFEDDTERFPTNNNNFYFNVDVLGPSFMLNINKKNSIGIITRARGFFNINKINGELYESVADDFDIVNDFDFDSRDLNGTIHVWSEIGLAYGRILMDKQNHLLTGGVTLKYLMGAGGLFLNSPELQGQYTAATQTLETQGSLSYGTTQDFDNDDINFDNLSSGYGLDIGFTYQWHPEKSDDETRYFQDPYKLKIGVSVTDIGSITYDDAEVTTYDMNATVNTSTFDEDTEDFLDNNYTSSTEVKSSKIALPTALHVLVDYRLAKKWLISAQADVSLANEENELTNSVINTITLAPRLETKWFSFYAPVSFRQYDDFAFGGGFRFGPLTVGSGSVFSNLLSDSSKTTDVYVGLKIPIYRN